MTISRSWALLLLGIPTLFISIFFITPFFVVVDTSLQDSSGAFTFSNYRRILFDPYYWDTLLLTFKLSAWVTTASFLIGYPIAFVMIRVVKSRNLRRLLYIIVIMPLFTSTVVRAFGWLALLGRQGLVNSALLNLGIIDRPIPILYNEFSIVVGLTYIMTPFMIIAIASALQNLDPSLERAARDLGATRSVAFFKVTFPLSLPGVIAGSVIVFTLSVSAYVTPSVLSGGKKAVMSMIIFRQYDTLLNYNFGGALAVVLLVSTLVLIAVCLLVLERRPGAEAKRAR